MRLPNKIREFLDHLFISHDNCFFIQIQTWHAPSVAELTCMAHNLMRTFKTAFNIQAVERIKTLS
jgi:hypothetical protein